MAVKYEYKAKDETGKNRKGIVEAANQQQALKVLQDSKLLVVALNEKKNFSLNSFGGSKSVSEKNVAQFTRLLSTMLSTGLPLVEALADLSTQSDNQHFEEVIQTVSRDVQGGTSLSVAMSRFPRIFNRLYLSIVKAGEASGKADEALSKLADNLESQMEFKSKVKGALLYPVIIVFAMGGIGTIMITQVIPKISEVYKQFGAELPLPTRILLSFGDFIINDSPLVVIIIVFIVVFYKLLRKNKYSDYLINNLAFKMPVFGKLSEEVQLTTMCETLATLLHSGVGIIEALRITADTLGNNYLQSGLVQTSGLVEKGLQLSAAFKRDEKFPSMISQLVSVGEETGTLDQSLFRLGSFFQESAERKVKVLTTALEPVLILIMGSAVGGLAIAVLLPMFNLVNVIK